MINYVMITLQVLLAELVGVAIFTGVLYIYWNALKDR